MRAFDTDILTQILRGNPAYAERVALIPVAEQALPILVAEEVLRGRLNTIRQAEAGKAKITIEQAYQFFEQALKDFRELTVLSYTPQAEVQYQEWRKQKLRGSTHDLRIAAICIAHSATLVTRNRRDFEHVPGLLVELWE
jgi:tRNA(fMet)-specific endonuclease VapC